MEVGGEAKEDTALEREREREGTRPLRVDWSEKVKGNDRLCARASDRVCVCVRACGGVPECVRVSVCARARTHESHECVCVRVRVSVRGCRRCGTNGVDKKGLPAPSSCGTSTRTVKGPQRENGETSDKVYFKRGGRRASAEQPPRQTRTTRRRSDTNASTGLSPVEGRDRRAQRDQFSLRRAGG